MGVVVAAVGVAGIQPRRKVHIKLPALLISQALHQCAAGGGEVDEGDALPLCQRPHGGGVGSVALSEASALKPPAGQGGDEHRKGPGGAGDTHVAQQIFLIGLRIGIPGGVLTFFIVVSKLDKEEVSGLHCLPHRLKKPLVPEALGAAAILGVVIDHYAGAEIGLQLLAHAPLGPGVHTVKVDGGISDPENALFHYCQAFFAFSKFTSTWAHSARVRVLSSIMLPLSSPLKRLTVMPFWAQ